MMDEGVSGLSRNAGTGQCHFTCLFLTTILFLTDAVGRKSVCRDDVSTSLDILFVNRADHLWSRETQHVVVAHQRHGPSGELPLMVALCRQSQRLNLGAHGPVQNQDPLL